MRLATLSGLATSFALGALLTGCPEKGGGPADKTVAEPEHAEPDDQGKLDEKAKRPATTAPAEKKEADEGKDGKDGKEEGGW